MTEQEAIAALTAAFNEFVSMTLGRQPNMLDFGALNSRIVRILDAVAPPAVQEAYSQLLLNLGKQLVQV